MFPFLERGAELENERWLTQLIGLARTLRSEKPEAFESLASQVEEDPSFILTEKSLLSEQDQSS